jgi:predicted nucleic acid-binding Zn ribbon protein
MMKKSSAPPPTTRAHASLRTRVPSGSAASDRRRPEPISDALSKYLKGTPVGKRVEAASVVGDWPKLVGKQIGKVTEPLYVTRDGVLFVSVKTNSWMSELSLLEPQLLAAINAKEGRPKVKKIRLRLMR